MTTEITVGRLEKVKSFIEKGRNCVSITLEGELCVSAEAVEWLKSHHYQLKLAETFGSTGIEVQIYPV